MSKFTDFYSEMLSTDKNRSVIRGILGDADIYSATDDNLKQLVIEADKRGYNITFEEACDFLRNPDYELSDDDLDAVAGGKGEPSGPPVIYVTCETNGYVNPGGGQAPVTVSCESAGTVQ